MGGFERAKGSGGEQQLTKVVRDASKLTLEQAKGVSSQVTLSSCQYLELDTLSDCSQIVLACITSIFGTEGGLLNAAT